MHNGCILWGGVGTGKSRTSLAYFVSKVCKGTYGDFGSMRTPRDIYIITTAKKRDSLDWEEEAIKFGISTQRDGSISGIQLVVDSWNNIEKYAGISDAFFIFDEQRLVGSGAWTKAFIKIAKRNEWILLSATPGDTWLDYIPVFVANGWYKNRTEFKRTHVVYNTYSKFPKVDRYVEVGKLVRYRNQILVHMPYERKTVRHNQTVDVDYDVELFNKVVNDRWHVYENRPIRDVAELFSVMRKVVNSNTSRVETVRRLLDEHPRLIVFYNFDYELEMLRTLSQPTSSLTSTTNGSSDTTMSQQNPSGKSQAPTMTKKDSASPSLSTRKDGGFWTEGPVSATSTTPATEKNVDELPIDAGLISSEETLITGGHWTEDLGDGEMWIPENWESLIPAWEEIPEAMLQHGSLSSRAPSSRLGESSGCNTPIVEESSRSNKHTSGLPSSAPAQGDEEWKTSSTKTRKSSSEKQLDQSKSCSKTGIDLVGPSNGSGQIPSLVQPENLASVLGASPGSSDSENSGGTPTKSTTSLSMSESETDSDFTVAEWNGHKHQPIPETDSWIYLVQYTAGSEGWNCVDTDAMVFFSLTYSYKQFHQAHGRIDRLNTPFVDLWYYTLVSNSLIDRAVSKSLRQKKSFNESKLPL